MKRMFVVRIMFCVSVVAVCLLTSACSYLVNFVVVNESEDSIEVEYTMKIAGFENITEPLPPPDIMKPSKVSLKKWEDGVSLEEWRQNTLQEYRFDQKTGKFILKIKPKEVVRILEGGDSYFSGDLYKNFPVTNIEIRGSNGKMSIDGVAVFKQFRKKDGGHYFLAYK